MNEKALVRLCEKGDSCAFEELIRLFYPYVSRFLLIATLHPGQKNLFAFFVFFPTKAPLLAGNDKDNKKGENEMALKAFL